MQTVSRFHCFFVFYYSFAFMQLSMTNCTWFIDILVSGWLMHIGGVLGTRSVLVEKL